MIPALIVFMALGQSPSSEEICLMDHKPAYCNMMATAPLKCGKYEFVATDCAVSDGSVCLQSVNPRCAPLMHTVTEKEWHDWQELLRDVTKNAVKMRRDIEDLQRQVKGKP